MYDLKKASVYCIDKKKTYFLDSNVWLKILAPKTYRKNKDKSYVDLFDQIIENNAKIAISSILLSEIINRILRDVYYQKFLRKNPNIENDNRAYKTHYRASKDYAIDYSMLCYDIKNYSSNIILLNDKLGDKKFKLSNILTEDIGALDFNDFYYYKLCKELEYSIVTDDKDFWVKDVQVITESKTLIDKHFKVLKETQKNNDINKNVVN